MRFMIFLTVFSLGISAVSADGKNLISCTSCPLDLDHTHEESWLRISDNNLLCYVQKPGKNFCYSKLVINLHDYFEKKGEIPNNKKYTIRADDLKYMLKSFKDKNLKEYFDVSMIDWAHFHPKYPTLKIKQVNLDNSDEVNEIQKELNNILIVRYSDDVICPDRSLSLYEILTTQWAVPINEMWADGKNFVSGLLFGSAAGIVVWGVLFVKDKYFEILLEDGTEIEALSAAGFLLPVTMTALTTGIVVIKCKINFNDVIRNLVKKCTQKLE